MSRRPARSARGRMLRCWSLQHPYPPEPCLSRPLIPCLRPFCHIWCNSNVICISYSGQRCSATLHGTQAAGVIVGGAASGAAMAGGITAPRRSPRRSLEMGAQPPAPAELTPDQGAMLQHLSAGASLRRPAPPCMPVVSLSLPHRRQAHPNLALCKILCLLLLSFASNAQSIAYACLMVWPLHAPLRIPIEPTPMVSKSCL